MATAKISLINTLTIPQRKLLLEYAKSCASRDTSTLADFRSLLLYRDKAYQRTLNVTLEHVKAMRNNLQGNAHKLQDLTVPIVMPQVESAVAYQAGVFLTSNPVFGVVADAANQDKALQFETLLTQQSTKFGWVRELIKTFRDGYKYNIGAAYVGWTVEHYKKVTTRTAADATAGMAQISEMTYGGNMIRHLSLYNCFMDMTVAPTAMHTDGEFFGWNAIMSRVALKQLISRLDKDKTTQTRECLESQMGGIASTDAGNAMHYYAPEINPMLGLASKTTNGSGNWGQWMGLPGTGTSRIEYKSHYLVTQFFCRALPSDFGMAGNTPRVYRAIIVNWSYVLFAEELNTAHDFLPVFLMQPNDDGLDYQTTSMLDNAIPFQDMSSALWAHTLESKRRMVFDRLAYNPRMIDKRDVDPASSVARIPIRNAALSDQNPFTKAIYQIPYRDDGTDSSLRMSDMISAMADQANGQNKVERGQFQKGNKTKTEFTETMSNSNSRQQLQSLAIQEQFISPIKETIKANTLQYQSGTSILNLERKELVQIDPVKLRETILEFRMSDGLLPASKMLNSDLMTVFLQTAQAIPGLSTEYDIMGLFMYWLKTQGAFWLDDFKRNPEQQTQFLDLVRQQTAAENPQLAAPTAPIA